MLHRFDRGPFGGAQAVLLELLGCFPGLGRVKNALFVVVITNVSQERWLGPFNGDRQGMKISAQDTYAGVAAFVLGVRNLRSIP